RRLALFVGIRHHQAGVTNLELRMHDQAVGPLHRLENSLGPESLLEKLDYLRRAANGKIGGNRVIAIGDGLYRHCRLLDCGLNNASLRRMSPFMGRSSEDDLVIASVIAAR